MMRVAAAMILTMFLAGCSSSSYSSDSSSSTVNGIAGPFHAVTLVDEDFSIPPGQNEIRLSFHLEKAAASSDASVTFQGSATGASLAGPGDCNDSSGANVQTGGSTGLSRSCGKLAAGDGALVIRVASGPAAGHAKLTASEQV